MALHLREKNMVRSDGVKLFKSWSDEYMIRKVNSDDAPYSSAWDVESSTDTYVETDIPLYDSEEGISE